MRWAAIRREAWRNLTSGASRGGLLALVGAALLGLVLAADLGATRALLVQASEFRASGANIITMLAPGGIDGAACDRLATIDGVEAAGALRAEQANPLRASALPGAPMPRYDVSPGLARVLGAPAGSSGIVLARGAADALGVGAGGTVATSEGVAPVAGVYEYPDDGRRPGLGYAALVPTSAPLAFDECWLRAWPLRDDARALLLLALGGEGDASPEFAQLNSTLGVAFDGAAAFDARITWPAAWVALGAFAALAALGVRLRRLELAAALHHGVDRRAQLGTLVLETAGWLAPITALGLAAVALIAGLTPMPGRELLGEVGLRIIAAAAGGALGGAACAALATRERHLARYVKDR